MGTRGSRSRRRRHLRLRKSKGETTVATLPAPRTSDSSAGSAAAAGRRRRARKHAHRGLCFPDGEKDGDSPGGAAGKIQAGPAVPASAAMTTSIPRPRAPDIETFVRSRKLTLILDLDHTLLNTTSLADFSPGEERNGFTSSTTDDPAMGLFRLDAYGVAALTKLRPFVRGFLEQASAMFEMHVYTLGDQVYARAAAKLLDPDGVYFGARIVSREDSIRPDVKHLDVVIGRGADAAAAVVILDDSDHVWPEHKENLILMDRYLYFAASCRQFGYGVNSLAEMVRDEREHDGSLAVTLGVLKRVHQGFFDSAVVDGRPDVREVIRAVRREVLRGCTVAFSRVIPLEDFAGDHHMWKLAERLGAVCATNVDAMVTHVVAMDPSTEKAQWARNNNKFLVNPSWIMAASFRWCRPNEQEFPVTRGG
nr:unnamed protein product [Digitaria exilis]